MHVRHILAVTVILAAACHPAYAVLTHRYSFNDGTANDSIGGANGILVNGATAANGQVVFSPATNDGTNISPATGQYVYLPQNYPLTRALTLEVWTTYRGGLPWQRIVDFGNCTAGVLLPTDKTTTGYTGGGFMILTDNFGYGILGQISLYNWGGYPTDYTASASTFPLNQEFHLVYTHDPDAGHEYLYLNGVQVGSAAATVDPSLTTFSNHFLGRSNFNQDPFYNGAFDEFRMYDNALSPQQVAADFAAGPNALDAPEPATLTLCLAGLALMVTRRRTAR